MKYLIILLLITGCSLSPKLVTRQEITIECVNNFLKRDILAKTSYLICKNIYKRGK